MLSFRHAFVRDPPRRVARRVPLMRVVLAAAVAALLVGGCAATADTAGPRKAQPRLPVADLLLVG
ncbi:MAG TPA: hypothetical protein VJA45_09325, partial [Methylomirabilota bacterium]|nr:hypothetical protein [Methylomirabilota bacterium]